MHGGYLRETPLGVARGAPGSLPAVTPSKYSFERGFLRGKLLLGEENWCAQGQRGVQPARTPRTHIQEKCTETSGGMAGHGRAAGRSWRRGKAKPYRQIHLGRACGHLRACSSPSPRLARADLLSSGTCLVPTISGDCMGSTIKIIALLINF